MGPKAKTSLTFALLVAALAPAGASAAATPVARLDDKPAAVRQYWTPKRMAAALPGEDLLGGILPGLGALSGRPAPRATGVPDPAAFPARTHGKVFFTLGGANYQCSGTAVTARRRNLVVSAGHCAYGDGAFATNWMFEPGHRATAPKAPYGKWVARKLATTSGWKGSEDLRYDVSIATVRKLDGRKLQRVVGARGITFNRSRQGRHFEVHGYPAEYPYAGDGQFVCDSDYQGADDPDGRGAPLTMKINCDQTGGASGGGWITGKGLVNSVISYGYDCGLDPLCLLGGNPQANKLFGPYFGSAIKSLYNSQNRKKHRAH